MTLFGCKKSNDPEQPFDGTYKGVFVWKQTQEYEDLTPFVSFDTFEMEFNIKGSKFKEGNCFGSFTMPTLDSMQFESDECGCWCGCIPSIDCPGNWLLGKRAFTMDGDSLKMKSDFSNTIEYSSGPTLHYRVEQFFLFEKQ